MDAVRHAPRAHHDHKPHSQTHAGEHRVRAFRATDQFALGVWQAVRTFGKAEGESLAGEIRRSIARSGGALVAAASHEGDEVAQRALAQAHQGLLEIRYFLYLARRLGCLDLKKYRELSVLQEAALREVGALLT
jgi:four helix bundle protein